VIALRTSSGLRQVGSIMLRTASGLRPVAVLLRTANGLRSVSGGPSGSEGSGLTVTPSQATAYIATKGPSSGYTNPLTTSGYSGTPDAIVWTAPSGWSVVNQGSDTTTFRSPSLGAGQEADNSGSVAVTFGNVTQTAGFDLYAMNQGVG
jgi:hypothetical protein